MPHPEKAHENDLPFVWGKKRGVGGAKKDAQFYESFTYDGTEYFIYDCVYLCNKGDLVPYIGKLVKIWDQSNRKKVKILWFFRPSEILNYLGDASPLENELFLATGEGAGLSNINPLEAVAGKCNVICTSKDKRNPQPSQEELEKADYIFYRTFDVGKFVISDRIVDKIDGIEARYLFNQKSFEKPNGVSRVESDASELRNVDTSNQDSHFPSTLNSPKGAENTVKDGKPVHATSSILRRETVEDNIPSSGKTVQKSKTGKKNDVEKPDKLTTNHVEEKQKSIQAQAYDDRPSKKMRLTDNSTESSEDLPKNKVGRASEDKAKTRLNNDSVRLEKGSYEKLILDEKRARSSDGSVKRESTDFSVEKDKKGDCDAVEVTRRPAAEKSKWFTNLPWEERIWAAHEQGTLVLLENLDLEYASEDIEDIIYQAFKQSCTARKIPHNRNPHNGQAFVIFKSRDVADLVVRKLSKGNLMLLNGRPLVGSQVTPRKPGKPSQHVGHLSIDKVKLQMPRKDMEKAVSTSHCSQPNTIEYEMAMDWMLIQKRSESWWEELHKGYGGEVRKIKNSLKTR